MIVTDCIIRCLTVTTVIASPFANPEKFTIEEGRTFHAQTLERYGQNEVIVTLEPGKQWIVQNADWEKVEKPNLTNGSNVVTVDNVNANSSQ